MKVTVILSPLQYPRRVNTETCEVRNLAEHKCLTQVVPTARRELERRLDRATAHQASQAKKTAWDGPMGHPKGADPDKSPPGGYATRRLNRARVRVDRDV